MEVKCINMKFVWGIFMVMIYLGMTFLLVFTNLFNENMSFPMRITVGILFFCFHFVHNRTCHMISCTEKQKNNKNN